jgi:hypothetical protein
MIASNSACATKRCRFSWIFWQIHCGKQLPKARYGAKHQWMLTRQQRRAIERRLPAESNSNTQIGEASLQTRTWRLLKLSKYLLWPIRQLPLWVNIIAILVTLGTGVLALDQFYDEAVPYIEPDEVTSTSWHDLPFKAKIDSHFFGAFDVEVQCYTSKVEWKGNGVTKTFKGKFFINVDPIESVIPPHGTITFACNMAEINGVPPPGDPVAPISLIELNLLMKYKSFLRPWGDQIILAPWQREMTSQRFTWREVSPSNFQWLEGEPP